MERTRKNNSQQRTMTKDSLNNNKIKPHFSMISITNHIQNENCNNHVITNKGESFRLLKACRRICISLTIGLIIGLHIAKYCKSHFKAKS